MVQVVPKGGWRTPEGFSACKNMSKHVVHIALVSERNITHYQEQILVFEL